MITFYGVYLKFRLYMNFILPFEYEYIDIILVTYFGGN